MKKFCYKINFYILKYVQKVNTTLVLEQREYLFNELYCNQFFNAMDPNLYFNEPL